MTGTVSRIERVAQRVTSPDVREADSRPVSELVLPNIVDFVLDECYLGITSIAPRQLLALKLIFCEVDLLTDYDHEILDQWRAFRVADDETRFEGGYGTTPDILERIHRMKSLGRSHFREVVMVLGRRAGKNWLGSIVSAYKVWELLCTEDPQRHFGIDPTSTLTTSVFAGQQRQAQSGQWQNIVDRIRGAPLFTPFLAEGRSGTLELYTPAQLEAGAPGRGERGLIEIVARESTPHGARGPSAFALFFDEMAHAVTAGANRGADELFPAAVPSLYQCDPHELIYESSSPASKQGAFYANYQRGLALENGTALHPDIMVLQLPTWDLYQDVERTHDGLEAYPGGPLLPVIDKARITYEQLASEERDDPDMFRVECRAQWRDSHAAYLRHDVIEAAFGPWRDALLTQQRRGVLLHSYAAHVDLSTSGANTALVVGHREHFEGADHIVIDAIRHWQPSEFPNGLIDYDVIQHESEELLLAFSIHTFTTDQHQSQAIIRPLQAQVRERDLRTRVYERTATARINWDMAERTKTLMGQGLVHLPYDEQADAELHALEVQNERVRHPTSGPVVTDDIADALFNVVWTLDERDYAEEFSGLSPRLLENKYSQEFSALGRRHRMPQRSAKPGTNRRSADRGRRIYR